MRNNITGTGNGGLCEGRLGMISKSCIKKIPNETIQPLGPLLPHREAEAPLITPHTYKSSIDPLPGHSTVLYVRSRRDAFTHHAC